MSDPVKFHLSLNVADLDKSVGFFRVLFGVGPAKVRPDYAKFEPADPPLVLSLEPAAAVGQGGALNHLGFRLPDAASLVAMQERLERAGLRTQREDGVECCYAKQSKFWAHDPDGNLWEVYTFDGDIDHRGAGQAEAAVKPPAVVPVAAEAVAWEHRMGDPVPDRIPLDAGTAAEVRLRGTFNLPLTAAEQGGLFAEAARVLRPGGRLFLHVLVGEQAVDGPGLPGPAAAVRAVPAERDPVRLAADAGFERARLLKFDAKPCFVRAGVGMRELQFECFTPVPAAGPEVEVVYKGPFARLVDDAGRVFARGERVGVPAAVADRFRAADLSAQFTVLEPAAHRPAAVTACGA